MRLRGPWGWVVLLAGSALATAVFALVLDAPDKPPSERQVERRLRTISARGGFPLHEARCLRDRVLRRTFVCVVEGPDDAHFAWEVRWLPDGRLAVHRPDGSRVPF
jgi:hypothetical protein